MINLESDIFTAVATALRTSYPDVFVTGEYVRQPPRFPAVSIIENGNSVVTRYRSSSGIENAAAVMYEVNIYTNSPSGKKSEARAIASVIDAAFASIGFTRTLMNQVDNLADTTIYRIVCRYEAIIDKDYWIYYNA